MKSNNSKNNLEEKMFPKNWKYKKSMFHAIRENCINCMGGPDEPGFMASIKACSILECPLWFYRFGEESFKKAKQRDPFMDKYNFIQKDKNNPKVNQLANTEASLIIKIIKSSGSVTR